MTGHPEVPRIACSLKAPERSDRRAVWGVLCTRALREQRPIFSGMQLVFAAHEGVENELHELSRLEAQCCAFAEWKVSRRDETVVLDVTAPGEAVDAVRAMFDRDEIDVPARRA